MTDTRTRLRIVQVLVTVVTAIDDGTDLHVNPQPQQQTIPTLAALQQFATVHLPAAIAAEEERLNAAPAVAPVPHQPNRSERRSGKAGKASGRAATSFPMGSEKQEQALAAQPAAPNGVAAAAG